MNAPIPVGLIGLGRHGSRYLQHLVKDQTGGKLVAISRKHKDEGRRLATHHRVRFFPDYRDLIADSAISAVLVVTPPSLNVPIALEAIEHGKAILLEKPLSLNSKEGQHIVDAAKHARVPIMTAHTLRYEPALHKLREIGSTLGPWQSLAGTMRLEAQPQDIMAKGTTPGVLLEFGVHLLDWIRVVTQEEILTVSAEMTGPSPNTPEQRSEVTLTTLSGIPCHLDISRVNMGRVTHVEIVGTKGRVKADWTNGVVQTFKQQGTLISQDLVPATPTLIPMLRDFFHALQTQEPVPITGEEGLRAVKLAEACYQAAQTGQTIYLK